MEPSLTTSPSFQEMISYQDRIAEELMTNQLYHSTDVVDVVKGLWTVDTSDLSDAEVDIAESGMTDVEFMVVGGRAWTDEDWQINMTEVEENAKDLWGDGEILKEKVEYSLDVLRMTVRRYLTPTRTDLLSTFLEEKCRKHLVAFENQRVR